jgi:hypothetical protein
VTPAATERHDSGLSRARMLPRAWGAWADVTIFGALLALSLSVIVPCGATTPVNAALLTLDGPPHSFGCVGVYAAAGLRESRGLHR